MSASANGVPDRYGECHFCDCPAGEIECEACAKDEWLLRMRNWLDRERVKPAGLTASEIAVVERLIDDLEARA